MAKKSKKIISAWQKVDHKKIYPLDQAISLAQKIAFTKFDSSIDLAFNLNLDVRKAEQQLRGAIPLPNSTGKVIRTLVATNNPKSQREAKEAGADIVLSQVDLAPILTKEKFDFDIIITDTQMMPFLAKYGKVLGPRGLMPNPKTGTVTNDIAQAIEQVKKGQANYRTDKNGIIHTSIGKTSMELNHLVENAQVIINQIKKIKPSVVKGAYIKNLTLSTTMGPSIKIEII